MVAVSGANEYTVKPLALVSTVTPPMVAVFRAVPEALAPAEGEEAPAAGALLELAALGFAELLHAAVIIAMAASAVGAHSLLRIACLRPK